MNYKEMKKALRNEIHLIEYPKDIVIQTGKNIFFDHCGNCNTTLESDDYIMAEPRDPMSDALCKFCYDKILTKQSLMKTIKF